jgi:hypothetical protein
MQAQSVRPRRAVSTLCRSVRSRRLGVLIVAVAGLLAYLGTGIAAPSAAAAGPQERPLTISIGSQPGAVIPGDFLGLSLETPALHLPAIETRSPLLANLLAGLGKGVLRVSGDSVDHTQWLPTPGPAASWALTTVTLEDLHHLAAVLNASGWRLILGLDLGHLQPSALTEEASAAGSILGASLAGLAIGNEPDLYTQPPAQPFRSVLGSDPLRSSGWSFSNYQGELAKARGAVAAAGASAPLYGPESATGNWLQAYASTEGADTAALSAHLYPLDRCRSERLLPHGPTIAQLLSAAVQQSETGRIRELAGIADSHHLPLRIDELGSIACGGQPGTSNTFAAALWALDAALIAAREGVAGVNFTSGLGSCQAGGTLLSPWYSPLCALANGQLTARPEYYALALLRSLEGCAFVPVSARSTRNVATFALRAPDGALHVVIDDMETATGGAGGAHASSSPRPISVTLRLGPAYKHASALRLSAPSAGALQGASLGGVALRANGTLPSPHSEPLASSGGAATVRVQPASATVVTLAAHA